VHKIGSQSEFERKQEPGCELDPDLAASQRAGRSLDHRDRD
jgi:hypothetical protein